MEHIIHEAHKLLLKERLTVAVAESCTGGLASCLLTELPGSSKYFLLGVVAYSNASKNTLLGIPLGVIHKNGAVSGKVADYMAKGIRKLAKADFGIGITGIAGPTGAGANKPIGTVFISISSKNKNSCRKFCFSGSRMQIRKKSALGALQLLIKSLP